MYQHPIIFLDTIDSTNLFAKELVNNHQVKDGTVIRAAQQNKGRGQKGNKWLSSPHQNLTFSIILFPENFHVTRHFELNQMFSLAVCDFLSANGITQLNVKWPNDVLIDGKKVAGILLENTIRGEMITTVIGGLGININQVDFDGEFNLEPVSMKKTLAKTVDLEIAFQYLLHCITMRYEQLVAGKTNQLKTDYENLLFKLNLKSSFITGDIKWDGTIRGVAEDGQLIVEDDSGITQTYSYEKIKMSI